MKKISVWARHHIWPARVIIITSIIILNILAIITGMFLFQLNIVLSPVLLSISLAVYYIVFLLYPSKRQKQKISSSLFYKKQKICDALLAACTFTAVLFISNDQFQRIQYFSPVQASSNSLLPADSSIKAYKSIAKFSASLKTPEGKKLQLKERKKLLKQQVMAVKNDPDMSKSNKVLLIILSSIVALGLLGLVAALACGISCDGSALGAILVGLGGTALVIFLLVVAIRAINGKKRKQKRKVAEEITT